MEELATFPLEDPMCGPGGYMKILRRRDSVAGDYIATVILCPSTGYRVYEEFPEEESGEAVITINVRRPEDLSTMILRSREALIKIPEIGLTSIPTPGASDDVTTVEGILEKYADHIEPLCNSAEDPGRCLQVVGWMRRAMRGEESFTLVIEDPSRRSRILRLFMDIGQGDVQGSGGSAGPQHPSG